MKAFAAERNDLVMFHCFLQWVAHRQLAEAQNRARSAGMRIGLYLDFAVGVAPDGSATWSDRALLVPGARIGAPPDYFNAAGQDWGLSPISPSVLAERHFQPIRNALDTVLAHAGALRIDHAMSLYRLFWIAHGFTAADGAYVRYPFADLVRTVAEVSEARHAIVIGEDLGIVPDGFRDAMHAADIQSYRVLFFEKRDDHFLPAEAYPRAALACITTHDTQTLSGWWSGHDLDVRAGIGMIGAEALPAERAARAHERRRLLGLLESHGLLPPELAPVMRGEAEPPFDLPASLTVALHRFIARTPSRLVAASADDLAGALDQVNIPGTVNEHPNWRRKLGVAIDDMAAHPLFVAVTAALREERPKVGLAADLALEPGGSPSLHEAFAGLHCRSGQPPPRPLSVGDEAGCAARHEVAGSRARPASQPAAHAQRGTPHPVSKSDLQVKAGKSDLSLKGRGGAWH